MRVAVIGYGCWGPNIARNLAATERVELVGIADLLPERLDAAAAAHPGVVLTQDAATLIGEADLSAVAVVTPAATHFALASQALETGCDVLLEKPMGTSFFEASRLVTLARERDRVLMVDHTFLYTQAVPAMAALLADGAIGRVRYVESTRVGPGREQEDVDVLWDLASHDLSILYRILPERPVTAHAEAGTLTGGGRAALAYLSLRYPDGAPARITSSWVSPVKERRLLIGGTRGALLYEPMRADGVLRRFDADGVASVVPLPDREPLAVVAETFRDATVGRRSPRDPGLDVIATLEAATRSMGSGRPEAIRWTDALP